MALSPKDRYNPNQINSADPVGYPYGKARNISALGNTDGTPYEEDLVNDLFGFQQAILSEAQIVPTNNPDTAAFSQYLDGLRRLHRGENYAYPVAGVYTFLIPTWAQPYHRIRAVIIGGGGGGGGGAYWNVFGSQGSHSGAGGGSGCVRLLDAYVSEWGGAGAELRVTVGAGGAGGVKNLVSGVGNDGADGGLTRLELDNGAGGILSEAPPGEGGQGGTGGLGGIPAKGGRGHCGGGYGAQCTIGGGIVLGTGGVSLKGQSSYRDGANAFNWRREITTAVAPFGGVSGYIYTDENLIVAGDGAIARHRWYSLSPNPGSGVSTPGTYASTGGGAGGNGTELMYAVGLSGGLGQGAATPSPGNAFGGQGGYGYGGGGGGGAGFWEAPSGFDAGDGGAGATGLAFFNIY